MAMARYYGDAFAIFGVYIPETESVAKVALSVADDGTLRCETVYGRVKVAFDPATTPVIGYGQMRRARERMQSRADSDVRYFRLESAAPGYVAAVRAMLATGQTDDGRRLYPNVRAAWAAGDAQFASIPDKYRDGIVKALGVEA